MDDFSNPIGYPDVMEADFRISIKDDRRTKKLKILLTRAPFGIRQFHVRMNGKSWLASGRPVSLTRVLTALRKSSQTRRRGRVRQSLVRAMDGVAPAFSP